MPRFPAVVVEADAARAECAERPHAMTREGAGQEALRQGWQAFEAGCKALVEQRHDEAIRLFQSVS